MLAQKNAVLIKQNECIPYPIDSFEYSDHQMTLWQTFVQVVMKTNIWIGIMAGRKTVLNDFMIMNLVKTIHTHIDFEARGQQVMNAKSS